MIFGLGVTLIALGFIGVRLTYTARDQFIDATRAANGLPPEERPWCWADTWASVFITGHLVLLAGVVKICINYLP